MARAVATGELDEGFVDGVAAVNDPLRLPEVGLLVAAVTEEPLAVAVAGDHPLLGRTVALEDLVDARWIDAPVVCAPLDELAAIARADGFRAALRYDGADVAGLLALVAAGHGLALLPRRVGRRRARAGQPAARASHRTGAHRRLSRTRVAPDACASGANHTLKGGGRATGGSAPARDHAVLWP